MVLLYHSYFGTTYKFASPWKGPYIIEKCLNDVTYRARDEIFSKQQIVHYDQVKPFVEPLQTSNVTTRTKLRDFQLIPDVAGTHKHIDETLNQDDCLSFLPAPFSIFTPIPAVGRTTGSTRTSRVTPITSSAPERRELTK